MANNFTVIPNELFDALATGDLTPAMFVAMQLLHRWADWQTGVARKVRAGRMEDATNGKYSASTFQEALRNLVRAGRIFSDHRGGSRSWYSITILNFTVLSGNLRNQVLNPSEISDWRVSRKSRRGVNQPEAGVRPGCDRGEAMRVLKTSLESSEESSSEERKASLASQAAQSIPNLNQDQASAQDSRIPIAILNYNQPADQNPDLPILIPDQFADQDSGIPVPINPGFCNPENESASYTDSNSVCIRSGKSKTTISIPPRAASATETLAITLREILDQPAGYEIEIWAADLEPLARRHNTDFISYVWDWAYRSGPPATVKFWQGRTFNAKNAVKHFESQSDQMERAQAAAKKKAQRINRAEPAIPEGIKL